MEFDLEAFSRNENVEKYLVKNENGDYDFLLAQFIKDRFGQEVFERAKEEFSKMDTNEKEKFGQKLLALVKDKLKL